MAPQSGCGGPAFLLPILNRRALGSGANPEPGDASRFRTSASLRALRRSVGMGRSAVRGRCREVGSGASHWRRRDRGSGEAHIVCGGRVLAAPCPLCCGQCSDAFTALARRPRPASVIPGNADGDMVEQQAADNDAKDWCFRRTRSLRRSMGRRRARGTEGIHLPSSQENPGARVAAFHPHPCTLRNEHSFNSTAPC